MRPTQDIIAPAHTVYTQSQQCTEYALSKHVHGVGVCTVCVALAQSNTSWQPLRGGGRGGRGGGGGGGGGNGGGGGGATGCGGLGGETMSAQEAGHWYLCHTTVLWVSSAPKEGAKVCAAVHCVRLLLVLRGVDTCAARLAHESQPV